MANGHARTCTECFGSDMEISSVQPEYTTVPSRSRGPYPPRATGFSGRWVNCKRCGKEHWQRTGGARTGR